MKKYTEGFNLIEVILAMATFALLLTAVVGALIYGQQSTQIAGTRTRASYIAEEGVEAVRNIRDASFSALVDGQYGLSIAGGKWVLTGSTDTIGVFTRTITISTVNTNTKQVISDVTWKENEQRQGDITLTGYLTNWRSP